MDSKTFATITRIAVTRNKIADLIRQADQIDLIADLSAISDELENVIHNIKALGA